MEGTEGGIAGVALRGAGLELRGVKKAANETLGTQAVTQCLSCGAVDTKPSNVFGDEGAPVDRPRTAGAQCGAGQTRRHQ